MTDQPDPAPASAAAPDAVPPAPPWEQPAAPPAPPETTHTSPGPQPGDQVLPSGVVIPGGQQQQAPPPEQQAPQPDPSAPQPELVGPWSENACHLSWLMGGKPTVVQKQVQPQIDPTTGQLLVDPRMQQPQSEMVMLPVPSPYQCIGPTCTLYDSARGGCTDRLLRDAQLALAEHQLRQAEIAEALTADTAPAQTE